MMKLVALFLLSILPLVSFAQTKETYPRIAMIEVGGNKRESNPDYRQAQSKADVLILGMWYKFSVNDDVTGKSLSVRDVVVDIKARAAAEDHTILIGKYTNYMESTLGGDSADKIESERGPNGTDWWVYTSNGTKVTTFKNNFNINITDHTFPDANGDRYPEWKAQVYYDQFFRDIPELDIQFIDNWFYRPRTSVADWDADGSNDSKNDPQVRIDYQVGLRRALDRARALSPDSIFVGNVDGEPGVGGMLSEGLYTGQIAGFYEGAMGMPWSIETWGTWAKMMQNYQTLVTNSRDRFAIMLVHGVANNYKMMRYGLASALMDDGHYAYTSFANQYRDALWFDEYGFNLGLAVDSPQFSEWQSGVYRREFQKGIALVNPKGNGVQTVTVGAGYAHISGDQDPRVNNGKDVVQVTLQERDGIILRKTTVLLSPPDAPELIQILD